MNELLKAKEDLTHERDEKLKEIAMLREKIADTQENEQKLEREREESQSKVQEVSSLSFFVFSSNCQLKHCFK